MEVYAFFCTSIDFTKIFVMSLDFANVKNNFNISKGMTYRMHLALQLLYFDLFLMNQYTTWCRWMFYLFLHNIVVYRHFSYFQYGFKMAANGHVTIFIIIGLNESFIY